MSLGKNIIELFTASRFKESALLMLLTRIHVLISILLLTIPKLINYIPSDNVNFSKWGGWLFAILGCINLTREYFNVKNSTNSNDKRILIRNLLSQLNHHYCWQGKCRITLFSLIQTQKDKWAITPYERTSVNAPAGIEGEKVRFRINKGLPGKAWATAWNGNDINHLSKCLQFGDIPKGILGDKEKLEKYYIETFSMTKEEFQALGDEKYDIASYMAVGIQNHQDMSLAGILVIDSTEHDYFIDFKKMRDVIEPTLIERSGLRLSMQQVEGPGDILTKPSLGGENPLEELAQKVLRIPSGSSDQVVEEIQAINRQLSASHQILELAPLNISVALSPLEWALKSIRDMRIK